MCTQRLIQVRRTSPHWDAFPHGIYKAFSIQKTNGRFHLFLGPLCITVLRLKRLTLSSAMSRPCLLDLKECLLSLHMTLVSSASRSYISSMIPSSWVWILARLRTSSSSRRAGCAWWAGGHKIGKAEVCLRTWWVWMKLMKSHPASPPSE